MGFLVSKLTQKLTSYSTAFPPLSSILVQPGIANVQPLITLVSSTHAWELLPNHLPFTTILAEVLYILCCILEHLDIIYLCFSSLSC
jgi:hypothetical protein